MTKKNVFQLLLPVGYCGLNMLFFISFFLLLDISSGFVRTSFLFPSSTKTVPSLALKSSSNVIVNNAVDNFEIMNVEDIKLKLYELSSRTSRGQTFSPNKLDKVGPVNEEDHEYFRTLVQQLEHQYNNDINIPELLCGEWELLICDDDITRSSPFFWSFQKAFKDFKTPFQVPFNPFNSDLLYQNVFKLTDNLPFKSIGRAIQKISLDANIIENGGNLVSQVEVYAFDSAKSLMTTTSTWQSRPDLGTLLEISLLKTEILESTIASMFSWLDPALLSFPSGAALELIRPGSSTVYSNIKYLDKNLRVVTNDAEDKVFIFTRVES